MKALSFILWMLLFGVTAVAPSSVCAQETPPAASGEASSDPNGSQDVAPGGEDAEGAETGDAHKEAEPDHAEPDDAEEASEEAESDTDPFAEFEEFGPEKIDRRPLPADERPLELMDRKELEDSGFEFGTQAGSVDRSTAFILSLSAGTAFHGVGHFYLGDTRSGFFLLGMELVSIGLMASSGIFFGLTEGASPAAAFFAPALQLGLATFIYSYLLDVVGSLQGEDLRLAQNTGWERGIGVRAQYGFFEANGLPMRHLIDAVLMGDAGLIYGSAATTQDIFLDASSYRGRIGFRPLRGQDPLTFVDVEAGGEYFQWQGTGEFGRVSVDGRIGLSYQIGTLYPNFDQFALSGEVGLGNHWYQIAPEGTTTFQVATSRLWVPFDVAASMNVSRRLNIRGGYGAPDLSFVPAIHRMLGVAHLGFLYRSTSYGDITLRAEIGDGFGIWLGGSLWFGR
jgi:hypothetical protein